MRCKKLLAGLLAVGVLASSLAGTLTGAALEAGGSVGYHKHVGEGEMYYIIKGHGEYQENGETMPISEGMTTMVYDGDSHGLQNSDDGVMEFLAFIIKE